MQYSQYYPQIIEDLKMNETQSLFQPKEGTLISKLNDKEQLKEQVVIFSHKKKEFVSKEIIFGFNCVMINDRYVELSRCYFEMRYTKIRSSDGFYIISIQQGNAKEFMIASNQTQFMRIQIFLKRFCINKNFAGKFQLIDQNGCLPQAQSYKVNLILIIEFRIVLCSDVGQKKSKR
ncbi:hypothetical protein FGO68_gene13374 [Halteria grandinella]|uniref:Uncharacterized protein n=1 Tax=Halteria grandinella TaxID=5974 RepID=A0A8J8SYD2_HALGN|nr:hypothetical protein FGO68_gene13374 [Halteria grandinella]